MIETLRQLFILFIFLGIGLLLGKRKRITVDKSNLLSTLLITAFLPSKVFLNFSRQMTPEYLKHNYSSLLVSAAIMLFLALLAACISKVLTRDGYERRILKYTLAITNYSTLGYVFIEAVLGEVALTNAIFFCIPVTVYSYTVGYALLVNGGNFFRKLLNPMTVSIVVGSIFGLCRFPVPNIATAVLSELSACTGPAALLFIGLVLSTFSIRDVLPDMKTVIAVSCRLLFIPLVIYGICLALDRMFTLPSAVFPTAVIVNFLPCGMNSITFPAMYGEDCRVGARLVLLSSLACIVTIPLWAWVLGL